MVGNWQLQKLNLGSNGKMEGKYIKQHFKDFCNEDSALTLH